MVNQKPTNKINPIVYSNLQLVVSWSKFSSRECGVTKLVTQRFWSNVSASLRQFEESRNVYSTIISRASRL